MDAHLEMPPDPFLASALASARYLPDEVARFGGTPGGSTLAALEANSPRVGGRRTAEQRVLRGQARAERRTAAVLDRLRAIGAQVLHDRRQPHLAAHVDHLVVMGSGIYVVETIATSRRERLEWTSAGTLQLAGVPLGPRFADTGMAARSIADTVATLLPGGWGVTVFPTVTMEDPQLARPFTVDGVDVVPLAVLSAWLRSRQAVLDRQDVAVLADAACRACPPMMV